MARLICPECDEVVKVSDGEAKSVCCPLCGLRLGKKRSAEDEVEDEPERPRKTRRKKVRRKDPLRGVITLSLLGPIGLAIACAAPFLAEAGTHVVIWAGVFIGIVGWILVRRTYGHSYDGEDAAVAGISALFSSFSDAFKRPRLLAAPMIVMLLGLAMFGEGIILIVAFKSLQEKPANPAPKGQQRDQQKPPGDGPNQAPNNPPAPPDTDGPITAALADLDKPDGPGRDDALGRLRKMQPKADRQEEVVKKLYEHLGDDYGPAQIQAIHTLGVWGRPDDVPTLIKLLDDKDSSKRSAAASAVTRFRDVRAVPGLIRGLQDPFVNVPKQALIEIGPAAEKELIAELSNMDAHWLGTVVEILKEIGTPESIPALRKMLKSKRPGPTPQQIQAAIRSINQRAKKDKNT